MGEGERKDGAEIQTQGEGQRIRKRAAPLHRTQKVKIISFVRKLTEFQKQNCIDRSAVGGRESVSETGGQKRNLKATAKPTGAMAPPQTAAT